jgi:7-cyano-7-deazaguanine synthase
MKAGEKNADAIALVSGGLDSCVAAAVAAAREKELAFLHVDYGQKTEARERACFNEIASFYGIRHQLIADGRFIGKMGGSSLTENGLDVPAVSKALPDGRIPSTYVPFRNTLFLSMAVAWAEVIGARRIYIGAVQSDRPGYPDCRAEFFAAFNELIRLGTRPDTKIEVSTPLIHMSKKDIVLKGAALSAPLHLTWSCYGQETVACGFCESCVMRRQGFKEAGLEDPMPYADSGPVEMG